MQWSVVKPLTLMQADVSGLGAMLSRPGYRNDGWRQMPNWGFASLTCICSSSRPQRPAEQLGGTRSLTYPLFIAKSIGRLRHVPRQPLTASGTPAVRRILRPAPISPHIHSDLDALALLALSTMSNRPPFLTHQHVACIHAQISR
jgi:hypothetical protein